LYIVCYFVVDKLVNLVLRGETFGVHIVLVLVYTLCKIAGYAGVDDRIGSIRKHIYIGLHNNLLFGERIATPVTSVTGSQ